MIDKDFNRINRLLLSQNINAALAEIGSRISEAAVNRDDSGESRNKFVQRFVPLVLLNFLLY